MIHREGSPRNVSNYNSAPPYSSCNSIIYRYTIADLKILLYARLHKKNNTLKILYS